jgi:hypothetical protein
MLSLIIWLNNILWICLEKATRADPGPQEEFKSTLDLAQGLQYGDTAVTVKAVLGLYREIAGSGESWKKNGQEIMEDRFIVYLCTHYFPINH